METIGSIMLVTGISGLMAFFAISALRPGLVSRTAATVILAALFLVAGIGLVLLTASSAGQSLHTGG